MEPPAIDEGYPIPVAEGAGTGPRTDQMYWGFFENALEGFFQTTPDGKYLRANPGLARIYGYESPGAVVAALTDIRTQLYVDPGRREEFSRLMKEAGEVNGFESEVYRSDRSVIWISENARVVQDAEGQTLHYEGTVQDITARKRAEAELGASQRFIERVAQSSPNILYVYDLKQRRYIYANNRVYELLGHKPELMTGIGTEFLDRFLHPDDIWLLEQRIRDLSQAEDGEVFEYEYRLLNCDGEWRWMNARETIFTRMSGEPHEIIGTAQDITERKYAVEALLQSEERFRQLVEGADAMFWERELAGGVFTYVGPQAERLLGYPIENWFTGDFWLNHVHPDDRERVRQFWKDAATRGSGSQTIEYKMNAANNRPVWVREFGHLSRGKRGALVLQGIMINITERQLARSEIQRSHRQLRALSARLQTAREEERTHIAREIHDELGGALTALKVDINKIKAECCHQREEDEGLGKLVERFSGVMSLIDRTMEGMRRLATELRPPILDAFGIVAAIEWQVTEFEKRFGVRCELVNEWHSPIVQDPALSTALFRIFQELLTNVARHSKASHVSVRLAEDAKYLTLSVHDNGRGITDGERHDALGLLGMQERALMFGGEVTIEPGPKKGTVATMRIPIRNIVCRIEAPKKERLWPS